MSTFDGGRHPIPTGMPVVIKAGSSSLVLESGALDSEALQRTVDHVADIRDAGHPALLVPWPPDCLLSGLTDGREMCPASRPRLRWDRGC
jgi:hypothetical protein